MNQKQHIEAIVEHKTKSYDELEAENKSLRHILSLWKKTEAIKEIESLQDTNRKLRLELSTLHFKESQEQRFIWWIWNVYSRNVCDLIYTIMGATTYDTEGKAKEGKYSLPKECFDLMRRLDEYTEHIYDGTYLDVEISMGVKTSLDNNKPLESDVSVTQDVLIDIKNPAGLPFEEDNECPDCKGCGQVAGDYFADDGIVTCDRCKGKGTI